LWAREKRKGEGFGMGNFELICINQKYLNSNMEGKQRL